MLQYDRLLFDTAKDDENLAYIGLEENCDQMARIAETSNKLLISHVSSLAFRLVLFINEFPYTVLYHRRKILHFRTIKWALRVSVVCISPGNTVSLGFLS